MTLELLSSAIAEVYPIASLILSATSSASSLNTAISNAELNEALERVFRPDDRSYNSKGRTTREGLEKVIEIFSNPPKTS